MQKFEIRNPDFAQTLQRSVLAMPIVKFYGLKFLLVEAGRIEIEMPYREELSFAPGAFQAGPIGTLMDIAAGCAVGTLLPAGWGNATVDFSVKLLSPAIGTSFIAHGFALSAGKTLSVGEAKVFAVDGEVRRLCASGMVSMRNFPLGS